MCVVWCAVRGDNLKSQPLPVAAASTSGILFLNLNRSPETLGNSPRATQAQMPANQAGGSLRGSLSGPSGQSRCLAYQVPAAALILKCMVN